MVRPLAKIPIMRGTGRALRIRHRNSCLRSSSVGPLSRDLHTLRVDSADNPREPRGYARLVRSAQLDQFDDQFDNEVR